MQPSNIPREELAKARAAIEAMNAAESMNAFKDAWKEYLSRLERVWYKAGSHYKRSPKWKLLKERYEQERNRDPLLQYLVKARGADEHTVEPITRQQGGTIGVFPGPGASYTEAAGVDALGRPYYKGTNATVIGVPGGVRLLSIKDRDTEVLPPKSHLGKPVDPRDVVAIASAGAEYYERLLSETDHALVK
jgi:hypothetical protein